MAVYLKLWHLSDPTIAADFILFDECQDANPVMLAVVDAQRHAQRIYVGDSCQQIYSFTGAVNALDRIRETGADVAYLTQSFRFGPAIADVANRILDMIDGATLRLVGTDSIPSVVAPVAEPDAILCRTNATAVRTVLRLQDEGREVALVGGGDDVVRFAKAARDLMEGRRTEHPDLACFDDWGEVKLYVDEDEQGDDLRLLVKLVEDFGVDAILRALDRTIREEDADVTVSTAHKAKGREWDAVQLAADFPEPAKVTDEELRLLYVAATRARRELDIEAVALLSDEEGDDREECALCGETHPAGGP
jgi:superfamily I DNA/RNA helicase